MKRIFVLCMACMVLFAGVAGAEIKKDKDETGLSVYSMIEKKDLGFTIEFAKNSVGEEVFYRIFVYAHSQFPEFLLADSPISVSIDKYPAFYLDEYRHGITKGYDEYYSSVQATVSMEMIGRVKNAKNIMILCKRKAHGPYILLGQDFLDEWKEVINTNE